MAELNKVLPYMDLSDFKEFAEMLAKIVSDQVLSGIDEFHYKIIAGIIGALVSAIVYMYLSQRADQKSSEKEKLNAYNKLFAVIAESTKTMEIVKNELNTSVELEERIDKSIKRLQKIVIGCKSRDKTYDDEVDND